MGLLKVLDKYGKNFKTDLDYKSHISTFSSQNDDRSP